MDGRLRANGIELAEEASVIIFFDDQEEIFDSIDFREWLISMPS